MKTSRARGRRAVKDPFQLWGNWDETRQNGSKVETARGESRVAVDADRVAATFHFIPLLVTTQFEFHVARNVARQSCESWNPDIESVRADDIGDYFNWEEHSGDIRGHQTQGLLVAGGN